MVRSSQDPGGEPFSVPSPRLTLDAAGYGFVSITVPGGVRWEVYLTTVSTNVTSATAIPPVVRIYRGSEPSPVNFVEFTYAGNGAPSDTRHHLNPCDSLTAEWTGGTPGSLAYLRLSGLQYNV
jgi:hypothetical protein